MQNIIIGNLIRIRSQCKGNVLMQDDHSSSFVPPLNGCSADRRVTLRCVVC